HNPTLAVRLSAAQTPPDIYTLSLHDALPIYDIDVTITGSNDNATITASATEDTAVLEAGGVANATAGDPSASGQLTVHDVDSGENRRQNPATLATRPAPYPSTATNKKWSYTL